MDGCCEQGAALARQHDHLKIRHENLTAVTAAYFRSTDPDIVAEGIKHLIAEAGFTYEGWDAYQRQHWSVIHPSKEGT